MGPTAGTLGPAGPCSCWCLPSARSVRSIATATLAPRCPPGRSGEVSARSARAGNSAPAEGPQGWPRDPVGSSEGRQLVPLLGGESQVGEGLESGLDIVMTLHVAGAGEPSLTSLHQRGLIHLDARAQEQVFRPVGSRSSSHVVSHSSPSIPHPHFPWKFIPWEGQGSLKGSRLSSPTRTLGTRVPRGRTPSCPHRTLTPQLNRGH